MRIDIPPDVRELAARKKREGLARRARSTAAAAEEARTRAHEQAQALEPARRVLRFARALAAELALPPDGLEIFSECRGRCVTRVRVLPDGALSVHHVVQPFAAFHIHATDEAQLARAPLALLRALSAAVESGGVWDSARGK